MKIMGVNSTTLTARAVAKLTGGGSRGCLYTLGLGKAAINAPNCGIVDNQDLTQNGASGSITAGSIGVVGAVKTGGTVTPTPVSGIVAAGDPLGYLTPPAVPASCTTQPDKISGNKTKGNTTVTLNPTTFVKVLRSPGIRA